MTLQYASHCCLSLYTLTSKNYLPKTPILTKIVHNSTYIISFQYINQFITNNFTTTTTFKLIITFDQNHVTRFNYSNTLIIETLISSISFNIHSTHILLTTILHFITQLKENTNFPYLKKNYQALNTIIASSTMNSKNA